MAVASNRVQSRGSRHRPAGAGAAPSLDALLADGLLRPRSRDPDHRPWRRLLRLRRPRQALPRRPLRPLLRQRRPRPRRARRSGRAPGRGARLLHAVELRAPARDRTRRAARLARPRRPQPRLLHLGRLGVGRVGAEAGPQLPPRARQRPEAQGDRARDRLPRHLARRALRDRHHRAALAVRAARPRAAVTFPTPTSTAGRRTATRSGPRPRSRSGSSSRGRRRSPR